MLAVTAVEGGNVVGFKIGERGIEHFPARHDDDVQTCRNLVSPEHFPRTAFGTVTFDCRSEFPGRRDAQPGRDAAIQRHEQHHVSAVDARAGGVGALEIRSAPDAFGASQRGGRHGADPARYRSSDTVRRFRPLVRRRFNTMRPFFVDIRTRNPCVFLRRRVLGWNVRFPLAMLFPAFEYGCAATRPALALESGPVVDATRQTKFQ